MTEKYVHQFKTMEDLRELIKQYESFFARPVQRMSHPTLYRQRDLLPGTRLIKGLSPHDWEFSSDEKWVLPNDERGLSFSAHWQHLKGIYKMKEKKNPGAEISVYWVLQTADIPPGLKFVADKKDSQHYFLAASEKMTVWQLVEKLRWVADRMSVMQDARRAL